jgi:hypothetical protein
LEYSCPRSENNFGYLAGIYTFVELFSDGEYLRIKRSKGFEYPGFIIKDKKFRKQP